MNDLRWNVAALGWSGDSITLIARLRTPNPLGGIHAFRLDYIGGWYVGTTTILGDEQIMVGASGPYTWAEIAEWLAE